MAPIRRPAGPRSGGVGSRARHRDRRSRHARIGHRDRRRLVAPRRSSPSTGSVKSMSSEVSWRSLAGTPTRQDPRRSHPPPTCGPGTPRCGSPVNDTATRWSSSSAIASAATTSTPRCIPDDRQPPGPTSTRQPNPHTSPSGRTGRSSQRAPKPRRVALDRITLRPTARLGGCSTRLGENAELRADGSICVHSPMLVATAASPRTTRVIASASPRWVRPRHKDHKPGPPLPECWGARARLTE